MNLLNIAVKNRIFSFLLFFSILFNYSFVNGQQQGSVSGTVLDNITLSPVSANITVKQNESIIGAGTVNSLNGEFNVDFTISDVENISQESFQYHMSNYPNPYNPSTIFSFQTPVSGNFSITVYNILGEELARMSNVYMPKGTNDFFIGGGPQGVEIVYVSGKDYSGAWKMINLGSDGSPVRIEKKGTRGAINLRKITSSEVPLEIMASADGYESVDTTVMVPTDNPSLSGFNIYMKKKGQDDPGKIRLIMKDYNIRFETHDGPPLKLAIGDSLYTFVRDSTTGLIDTVLDMPSNLQSMTGRLYFDDINDEWMEKIFVRKKDAGSSGNLYETGNTSVTRLSFVNVVPKELSDIGVVNVLRTPRTDFSIADEPMYVKDMKSSDLKDALTRDGLTLHRRMVPDTLNDGTVNDTIYVFVRTTLGAYAVPGRIINPVIKYTKQFKDVFSDISDRPLMNMRIEKITGNGDPLFREIKSRVGSKNVIDIHFSQDFATGVYNSVDVDDNYIISSADVYITTTAGDQSINDVIASSLLHSNRENGFSYISSYTFDAANNVISDFGKNLLIYSYMKKQGTEFP